MLNVQRVLDPTKLHKREAAVSRVSACGMTACRADDGSAALQPVRTGIRVRCAWRFVLCFMGLINKLRMFKSWRERSK